MNSRRELIRKMIGEEVLSIEDLDTLHKEAVRMLDKLTAISKKLTDIKEKISLARDTCCYASVDLDFDEFDLLIRDLEDAAISIENLRQGD